MTSIYFLKLCESFTGSIYILSQCSTAINFHNPPRPRGLYLAKSHFFKLCLIFRAMEKKNTTTLEEKLYWGHFSTIHFAQFLLTDFEDHLDLPDKFTSNLKHKLPGIVTLRGPTGVKWNVGLAAADDTLAFKHGWKQFVRDNSLAENDFLFFKYNGESVFDVLMFDPSLCEKAATYFVRESGGAKNVGESQIEERKETYGEVVLVSPPDGASLDPKLNDEDEVVLNSPPDGASLEPKHEREVDLNSPPDSASLEPKHKDEGDNDDNDEDYTTPTGQNSFLQLTEKEVITTKAQCVSRPTRRGSRTRRPSRAIMLSKADDLDGGPSSAKRKKGSAKQCMSKGRPITEPGDLDGSPSSSKRRKGCASAKHYESKRRPITEQEKKKALEAAKAAANEESAVVILRPSAVSNKFYAVIPIGWLHKHLRPENQDVILRSENKTWRARFRYVQSRNYGGLSGRWKDFVVDNNLEEHDVCVFQLAPGSNTPIIVDVNIFRVVEDTAPQLVKEAV